MKPNANCEECKGLGEIEVETIHLGRMFWGNDGLQCEVEGKGDWHMAQCPCVGEDE